MENFKIALMPGKATCFAAHPGMRLRGSCILEGRENRRIEMTGGEGVIEESILDESEILCKG